MRWDIFGYVFGMLFFLLLIFYGALAGIIKLLTLTSTRYGPGYSEPAFRKLRIGASERGVRADLGPPISEFRNSAGEYTMIYSLKLVDIWRVAGSRG